ncbi:hypothetical protein SAMN02799630_05174 [Paenibacillus sp. UNCCL117]|uniref:hypothetical protein n=1 Tax=unclassified Paenibacillus TaxID=185978 RepID=UPI00087FFFEC|nr:MULTISPECIES: hypothetical protein [unclassified Paenibacillus]SDE32847.1 hypothetical protein SAMN04488602_12519 [Paenibacillus sp. cl123]SFW63885.1 hypothetical protein SAMN02799630_05174 [Paenibacillus sp. UNCCL117]
MWKAVLMLLLIFMAAAAQAWWLLGKRQYKECVVSLGLFAASGVLFLLRALHVPVPDVLDMLSAVYRPLYNLLFH